MRNIDFDYLIKGLLLFVVYFVTARIGLTLNPVSGFATLVWLPTGISIAALFLMGLKYWPFILLGAFSANFTTGATIPVAFAIGIGNGLEAYIAALFLKSYVRLRQSFDNLRQVSGFVLVIVLSTLISASIGVFSLFFGHVIAISDFGVTWLTWWIGDMVSGLILTPFILIWTKYFRTSINFNRVIEFVIPILLLILVSLAIFNGTPIGSGNVVRYLVYPPLIWVSLRFSPRITITTIFILTALAVSETLTGQGPFVTSSVTMGLLNLQVFIAITSATMLILSAASAENRYLAKRKDEFISVASHELKTPLTSLKLGVQLLQKKLEKKRDVESLRQVKRINFQVDRTIRLAMNLLDTKSLSQDKIKLKKENFILCDLVEDLVEETVASTKRKIIVIKRNDINVFADKDKIGQVIYNLLNNAIKYSPKNKKIFVASAKKGNEVIIKVQDFGDGVSAEEQKEIFKSYYRVKKQKYSKDISVGLGLYISKRIIESHRGKIGVESPYKIGNKKIKGSSFYFSLPIS